MIRNVSFHGFPKKEFISLKEPVLDDEFTADEISIVDDVVDAICRNHTAVSISRLSHDDIWEMAAIGEELPIYVALAERGEITEEDVAWADEKIRAIEGAAA